ncbi:MAG: hypothetical protein CL927_05025 [Deltaproteobacteria bacterium]|nr:hypothetical protein [Deltaproteobacteria bacterium]HCH65445.1 hypothetical protein [Deltaproteobacteria bacterium]
MYSFSLRHFYPSAIGLVGLLACSGGSEPKAPDGGSAANTADGGGTVEDSDGGNDTDSAEGRDTGDAPDTGDESASFAIDPADPALRYVGRWNFDDPTLPWAGWQGASVALAFEGTDLSVSLDPGSATEFFRVIIDGDHMGSDRFAASTGVRTYAIAEGLEPGVHTVELVKETYIGTNWTLHGFTLTGTGLRDAPGSADRHIAFYGDSNLAGYSLMSEQNASAGRYYGSHFTLAGVTARAFGADYHNVSVSGETLAGMVNLYDRADYYDTEPSWDFERYVPDVVVMNLGANDINWASESVIRDRYVVMLDRLRAAHPNAHIVVFNGFGWDFDEPADYTPNVVASYGDPNVSVALFPWVFEQWHGCETDHAGMARYLIAHLEAVVGWEASEPELMNGFGWEGGIANGGFETVAPFGGYGWRYYTGTGVERVADSAGAYEGTHYLRLSDGAEVHQPNPAGDGDRVDVELWVRGTAAGETAEVTIDFRNQAMWSAPLQSESWTIDLTSEWSQVTLSATAPTDSADPVFHTRLTLRSSAGSMLHVDGIEMQTTVP